MLAYPPTRTQESRTRSRCSPAGNKTIAGRQWWSAGMHHCRKHLIRHHPGLRYASVLCTVTMLNVLPGCVTMNAAPEMAWVRTDGRRITDDPALLQKGKTDIALCHADLD